MRYLHWYWVQWNVVLSAGRRWSTLWGPQRSRLFKQPASNVCNCALSG